MQEHILTVEEPKNKIEESAITLLSGAKKDALKRLSSPTPDSIGRIERALERRLKPYILENETIAYQLATEEYRGFTAEVGTFLDAKVGFIICPDGRISSLALGDPRIASFNRRLQGLPDIRRSTGKSKKPVLDDPDLSASVATAIQERQNEGKSPELIEFLGIHIHSEHPVKGCGARIAIFQSQGRTPEISMTHGGIKEYFEELGTGFNAFNTEAQAAEGKGTTFDLVHDAYSQGFIIGLRQHYKDFDLNLTLRENLNRLAAENKILMTEKLDQAFHDTILTEAEKIGKGKIDINDIEKFAENAMTIGRTAIELTKQEEKKGFTWIPDSIKDGKSEKAIRILAYHALRNVVYRTLGNISPGQHRLLEHPEQLIRSGPIGAEYNIRNIPFIQNTSRGRFKSSDIERTLRLHELAYDVLKQQGVDLTQEGRIILVTGEFDPRLYANDKAKQRMLNEVAHVVLNNAAWVRRELSDAIETGETIVIACLYDPVTRGLTDILTSP